MDMGTCKFCGNAAGGEPLKFDFPVCEKHKKQLELFLNKKKDMQAKAADMRVLERFMKLNPGFVRCPMCGSGLILHHWKKEGDNRTPIFKCRACDLLI
jgi:uncharacterized protein with PIN domain